MEAATYDATYVVKSATYDATYVVKSATYHNTARPFVLRLRE